MVLFVLKSHEKRNVFKTLNGVAHVLSWAYKVSSAHHHKFIGRLAEGSNASSLLFGASALCSNPLAEEETFFFFASSRWSYWQY